MDIAPKKLTIIICPGMHDTQLTANFLARLWNNWRDLYKAGKIIIIPNNNYPVYSPIHIWDFLTKSRIKISQELIFIAFSAGVVGGIGAALIWQQMGGKVKAFIAVDGWGMILAGNFPIHRISHDYFTHWSSALLGGDGDSFYADREVDHLTLWTSPQTVKGWQIQKNPDNRDKKIYITAAEFILNLLNFYGKI